MNQLAVSDHFVALIVFFAYPLVAWRGFRTFVAKVSRYGEPARIAAYQQTILFWDIASLALIAAWVVHERSWADLGILASVPGQLVAGLGVGAILIVFLFLWQHRLYTGRMSAEQLAEHIGDLEAIMPRTAREQRWFRIVSINAAICEELLARGFLLWYLGTLLGPVSGPVTAVALFAGAHAYQGLRHMPALIVASAAFVAMYIVSGSLLVPILLHGIVDLAQGHFIAKALRTAAQEDAAGDGPVA